MVWGLFENAENARRNETSRRNARKVYAVLTAFCITHNSNTNALLPHIPRFIFEQIIKIASISKKDIAKECAKIALPMAISWDNNFIKNYGFDYGCEAAWAGYYDGIDAIPGALIKYACVDACYHQLCKGAELWQIDYPEALKKQANLFIIARILAPIIIKRCIGQMIDTLVDYFYDCQQEDLMQNTMYTDFD